jgi:hypothetical protein
MEDDKVNVNNSGPEEAPKQDNSGIPFPDSSSGVIKSWYQKAKENKKFIKASRITFKSLIPVFTVFVGFVFIIYLIPGLQVATSGHKAKFTNDQELKKDQNYKKQIAVLSKDVQRLSKKYSSYTSDQSYIVINTTDNEFFLYKNKKLVRKGLCSSGANKILQTENKTYIFRTPKGKFSITGKRTHPYWHRSDWDFIEQGLPVPPKDDPSRWEAGILGDYALDLVDGYMIHGTIYKRLMGMPVTHGCVRLGDEDLEIVYNTLNIGSKVYIF